MGCGRAARTAEQAQNKKEAIKIITLKVNELEQHNNNQKYSDYRKSQIGTGNRGMKIRTYNFIENRCVDHRTGKKTNNMKEFLKGNIEVFNE
jgi:peptide chain release factor 1